MSKILVLKPRLSEKAYGLSEQLNTYVFDVPKSANKQTVSAAVSSQYSVGVSSVNIATTAPKSLRTYKKRGRNIPGQRAAIRKAYVTLKEGDKLPIFAAADDKSASASSKLSAKEKK